MVRPTALPILFVQLGGVVLLLGIVAMTPPVSGAMLLVPLGRVPVAALAVERGAVLLADGPLPRSLVVSGKRARLWPLLRAGVMTIPARMAGCTSGEPL